MKKKLDLQHYKLHFQNKLERQGECLIYMGGKNPKGYGQFSNPWTISAHRFSWIAEKCPIPKGLMVLHNCDMPSCCEITHLRLGTAKENTADMISRGRAKGAKNPLKGENNPVSKITDQQAIEIAQLISQGLTGIQISKKLNISLWIVQDIRCKRTWKHLNFTIPKKKEYKKNCLICGTEFRLAFFEYEKSKYCKYECYWTSMKKKQ